MEQKDHSGNNPVISAVIAAACIVVYVAAMVYAVFCIYISIDTRRTVAEHEFFDIADKAASAGVLGFMDKPFVETINDALAQTRTLEALIISGPDGEYAFEREQGKAVNWVNNSPRFRNRFDLLSQSLYQPLRISGLRNVNIQAVAGALDYRALSRILKQTLLIVLAALALAFFTLLMESLLGKNGDKYRSAPYYAEERRREYPPAAESEQADEAPEPEEPAPRREPPPPPPMVKKEEPVPPAKAVVPREPYSPYGNICWEDAAEERLRSELHRCASTEQDLTFILLEIKRSCFPGKSFYRIFADEAVRFFTVRDLVFEKGERGIAVICPGIDFETAFDKCGEFHSRIVDKYPEVFKLKTDLCAGLSSRSGRLIEAKRLIFEANEALGRSLEDRVSHIVAFKSDPDKYRAFIRGKTRRTAMPA